MSFPPVLTAERIDAMLSVMAEVCFEAVVEAGQRQKAAEDFEAFERAGRTLQRTCRNLRQTIAMKQRFDREEAAKAARARDAADAERVQVERERREAVARRRTHVRREIGNVVWDEYEEDDACEMMGDVDLRLGELMDEPDFLEIPVETLVRRLARDLGLGAARTDRAPDDDPPDDNPPDDDPTDDPPDVTDAAPEPSEPPAPPVAPPAAPDPPAQARPPDPPPRPPDPQPYIPPWEQLRPGARMPGGTGW